MKKLAKSFHQHIFIFSLILLAVMIRLVLINIPAFKIDMDAWVAWTYRLIEYGPTTFYSPQIWTNYTPGYLYILMIVGMINNALSLSIPTLILTIKGISILFEIALVLFIYFKSTLHQKDKYILAILLLFNPAFIFNSTIWGQIDGILTYFLFISIFYLTQKKPINSSLAYSYAFLIKPQAIALAPLFIIELIKNKFSKTNLKLILPGLLLFFLLSLPFFISDPLFGILKLIFQMSQDYPATSLFAYNLWGIVGFWVDDLQIFGPFTYRTIGTIIFGTSILGIIYLGIKQKANYFLLAPLLFLAFYFLPTRVHERYLYPALPVLFYCAFLYRDKILLWLTTLLSATYALNLYYVYVYYNELFDPKSTKVLYFEPLYSSLDRLGNLLSLFSTLIFSMIIWSIIKIIYAQKENSRQSH